MSFKDLGLSTELLATIKLQGYTKPSPIQAQAIPEIFKGRDILGGAQTGTGKTAAFALPLIQNLSKKKPQKHRKPRALILTPTRELAAQVNESMCSYGRKTNLSTTEVYGGVNINPQIKRFRNGVDIVVATPGRLLDHLQRKTVDLTQIEFLVMDEADRMLDMGFINDIRKIVSTLPKKRQNLMFSATYSQSIKKLADTLLNNPVLIEVAKRNMATEMVTQYIHPVERGRKRELLSSLIRDEKWEQVLVFTRTKNGANRLTKQLMKDGIQAAAIHGNKSQSARTQALLRFKNGKVRTLVATDVAARGLDINLLPHVVNFDLPNAPEDYVHRIGRTGRAGQNGVALSLVCSEEQDLLVKIQRLLNKKITVKKIDGFQAEPATKTQVNKRAKRSSGAPKKQNRKRPSSASKSGRSVFSLAGQNKTRRISGNA